MTLRLDHLAVSALTLAEGTAAVEAALGIPLAGGGQHTHMATHNRLLGLGDIYLEVIAPDPTAPRPTWPRWFDLDHFTGPPRLTNWIAATDDLSAALTTAPKGTGIATPLARGEYRWQMAIPADGRLPFDNAFPALIQWHGDLHPARALPDNGIRLTLLEIAHPDAPALRAALTTFTDPRVQFTQGATALRATFATPHGPRHLE
jgi:hypothetical protein